MRSMDDFQIVHLKALGLSVIRLYGNLARSGEAEALLHEISRELADGCRAIVLNLEELTGASRFGVAALLGAQELAAAHDAELHLIQPSPRVMRALEGKLPRPLFEAQVRASTALLELGTGAAGGTLPASVEFRPARLGHRVAHPLPLRAKWTERRSRESITEVTVTEVLNCGGARVHLQRRVAPGLEMMVENLSNNELARACLVWVGAEDNRAGQAVGLKFLSPCAGSWSTDIPD